MAGRQVKVLGRRAVCRMLNVGQGRHPARGCLVAPLLPLNVKAQQRIGAWHQWSNPGAASRSRAAGLTDFKRCTAPPTQPSRFPSIGIAPGDSAATRQLVRLL